MNNATWYAIGAMNHSCDCNSEPLPEWLQWTVIGVTIAVVLTMIGAIVYEEFFN